MTKSSLSTHLLNLESATDFKGFEKASHIIVLGIDTRYIDHILKEKGKVVHESMPGRVITDQHSSPLSLHYPEREVCAGRLPASRDTLLSNTRAAQPSGRTSLVTPGLERAGHPQAPGGPYPAPNVYTSLPPAQVTGGCYTTQLSSTIWNMPYIDALNLRCNSYGFGEALVLGSDRGDFWA